MPPRKVTWSTNAESSKYITDEMLAPFVSNFLPTTQGNKADEDILSKNQFESLDFFFSYSGSHIELSKFDQC